MYHALFNYTNVVVSALALFDSSHKTIGTGSDTDVKARRWSRCIVGMDDDDAGHVIANNLGGSGKMKAGNIFPQDLRINRGKYRVREMLVEKAVDMGCRVCLELMFDYPEVGMYIGRPNSVTYNVYVNYNKNPSAPFDFSNPKLPN